MGTIEPYLFFDGRCEEALNFYRTTLGAEITALMRFKDCPDPNMPTPVQGDKVMHANLRLGNSTIMASDGNCAGKASFQGFCLTHNAATAEEAKRIFAALSEGGQVTMPLTKTFFSPAFGMLNDRFGVPWMVVVPHEK